ncbi:hypothetical protein [Nocardia abscessus]|uniref:hypothetical protein n=1 Tax=Nocardia abscessus TaxID=120957 RepID=UPI002455A564|nr:hypothetical protein [Nocardia abscessus]
MNCASDPAAPLFPDTEQLLRAFCGEPVPTAWREMAEAAAAMVGVQQKRRAAMRRFVVPEECSHGDLLAAVRTFIGAEIELATLATTIDHAVARMLQDRETRTEVRHTETVGSVVSRLAELWLNDLHSDRDEDSRRLKRIGHAYDCLIADLTACKRLPPDM